MIQCVADEYNGKSKLLRQSIILSITKKGSFYTSNIPTVAKTAHTMLSYDKKFRAKIAQKRENDFSFLLAAAAASSPNPNFPFFFPKN
jgi:hypothetical protein